MWRESKLFKSKEKLTSPHVFLWSLVGPLMMIPCKKHSTHTQSDSSSIKTYVVNMSISFQCIPILPPYLNKTDL